MPAKIRKIIVQADAVHIEMGQAVVPPKRRALAMVVIKNPYAGAYSKNFDALLATGEELGTPPPLRPTLQTTHGLWRAWAACKPMPSALNSPHFHAAGAVRFNSSLSDPLGEFL